MRLSVRLISPRLARCKLQEAASIDDIVRAVAQAISNAKDAGVEQLLVDLRDTATSLSPSLADRYLAVSHWAEMAESRVQVALVAPPSLVDAERFGSTIAANLGFRAEIFTSCEEALAWFERT